jgi:tetratricopeptide (TPR) repeat protein
LTSHIGRHRSKNSSAEKKNRELASLLRKYALGSPQHADSDRIKVCDELANALESTKNDGDMVVLASCIEVETELLDLHPPGHPGRAKRASNLAHSLRVRFEKTNDYHSLTLAIELGREALSLRPDEHPLRAQSCNILATLLTLRFEHTADEALLDEAIQLEREALALRPYYDADRVYVSCFNLAASLVKRFERTGDASLLDEAIDLERQVLGRMTRVGHPDRAMALTNLALSLQTYFNHTGAISMLDEALQLHRESFALRPANHPLREMSCTNLASSLMAQFERTGDGALLDEAVQLQREALALDPDDHPNKAITYVNLAASLSRRYEQTADKTVLDEAIRLQRHSLVLLPAGHVHRADACANLAAYLKIHFDVAGRIVLLDEAIKLEYEVLLLRPEGHPKRPEACANTAVSLKARFAQTGDRMVLNEAVELEREALRLCPRGHSDRVMARTHLAASLLIHFRQCGEDNILLSEASDLVHEALEMCPLSHPQRWRCLRQLTELALLRRDYGASVEHLNEALRSPTHEKLVLLQFAVDVIGRIDTRAASCASSLLIAYAGILDLMSLSSNFALDVPTQLQHTLKVAALGSAAFMTASRANNLLGGLQLLERARGMVWAQMLHWRNPRLDRVPGQLAQELQSLLRACVLSSSPASLPGTEIASSQSSFQPERDRLYAQRSRLQQVLQEIRALPGLENVMRGPDAGALLNVSLRNAVVVLVADDDECHALVLVSPQEPLVDVALPGVDARTLQELTLSGWAPQKRGAEDDDADEQRLGMKTSKRPSHAHAVLAKLWRTVVKPVLSRLSLVVSPTEYCCRGTDDRPSTEHPRERTSPSAALVSHRRICIRPRARSRDPRGPGPGVLRRLRHLVLHTHAYGAPARPA